MGRCGSGPPPVPAEQSGIEMVADSISEQPQRPQSTDAGCQPNDQSTAEIPTNTTLTRCYLCEAVVMLPRADVSSV